MDYYKLKVLSNSFNNVSTYDEQPLHFDSFYIPENCKISRCFSVNHGITIDNLYFPGIFDNTGYSSEIFNTAPVVTNIYLPDTITDSFYVNAKGINIWNISDIITTQYMNTVTQNKDLVKSVHFKPGTKALYYSICSNMVNLKTVEFADSIEEIKEGCFYGCVNADISVMPRNIKYIRGNAFANCLNIKSLNL